ncbi:MAG: hypothetical protein ACRDN9_04845 [Streptosporangiaceae bacterium]
MTSPMSPRVGDDTVDRPPGGVGGDPAAPEGTGQASVAAPLLGAAGSVVGVLVGGWLMLAPFALGYQPGGADWSDTTVTDFFTGLGVAVVAAVAVVTFAASLVARLRAIGAFAPRTRRPEERPAAGSTDTGGSTEPRPPAGEDNTAATGSTSDLAALLEPLVRALQEDLAASGDARRPADPYPQAVSRRNQP